jgi:predicted Ser/Thr protein kinase
VSRGQASPSFAGLTRGELGERTRSVLHRGGWGNPDVLLVECRDGRLVVVKDYAARSRWVRSGLGARLLAREEKAYGRLEGIAAVPRLLGRLDGMALVIEYRPGVLLSRSLRGSLPTGFMGELERAVVEMHRRGVVHLDLRHRSNVLAGEDGRPVLIDFASAQCLDPSTRRGRMLVSLLGRIDRGALEKWRARIV